MGYQLGAEKTFKVFTGKVGVLNTGNPYVGFKAFAKNEKTGTYREVFGVSSDTPMVDGQDQGGYFHHTHETNAEAAKLAWQAYRWMNKGVV